MQRLVVPRSVTSLALLVGLACAPQPAGKALPGTDTAGMAASAGAGAAQGGAGGAHPGLGGMAPVMGGAAGAGSGGLAGAAGGVPVEVACTTAPPGDIVFAPP